MSVRRVILAGIAMVRALHQKCADIHTRCSGEGISAPTAKCDPGYYCVIGSNSSTPAALPMGGPCAAGGYCPQGSHTPLPCPVGTYQNIVGSQSPLDCLPCPPGFYCQS